jgi:hypothetical protein
LGAVVLYPRETDELGELWYLKKTVKLGEQWYLRKIGTLEH